MKEYNHMLFDNKKYRCLAIVTIFLIISFPVFLFFLSEFISVNKPVDAEILVYEGWLYSGAPYFASREIEKNNYEKIISTGLVFDEYKELSQNAYMVFDVNNYRKFLDSCNVLEIILSAYGSSADGEYPILNLWINDTLVSSFHTKRREKYYSYRWEDCPLKLDSVTIQFVNDIVKGRKDRNVYIGNVCINSVKFSPFDQNVHIDYWPWDGENVYYSGIRSYAELGKEELIRAGIQENKIIALPSKRVRLNRTLQSVLTFREWYLNSKWKGKSLNIMTSENHSRRTFYAYRKILGEDIEIGILTVPNQYAKNTMPYKVHNVLREGIGLMYYKFIAVPLAIQQMKKSGKL